MSHHADHDYDLNYAAKDASDVARTLGEVRKGTVARVYSDAQVTRESLAEARKFLEQAKVDDTVVVFVAGHGLLADDFCSRRSILSRAPIPTTTSSSRCRSCAITCPDG